MKNLIRILYIPKSQRKSMFLLSILVSGYLIYKYLEIESIHKSYSNYSNDSITYQISNSLKTDSLSSADSLPILKKEIHSSSKNYNTAFRETHARAQTFKFDPNKLGLDSLVLLGLSNSLAQRIIKYRNKGGRFKTADDIEKIYGLPMDLATKLKPLIQISYPGNKQSFSVVKPHYLKGQNKIIDINLADTSDFKSLKGVGSVLSKRIIKFRTNLGGFHKIEQISEVYGIEDSIYQNFKSQLKCHSDIDKIPINKASKNELARHPYIDWKSSEMIIKYRLQHEPFGNINDLYKIIALDSSLVNKIEPYLEF